MSSIVIGDGGSFPGTAVADAHHLRYDDATDMWTVVTPEGWEVTARTVIDTRASRDPAVADHGQPNYFRIPGPEVGCQARFVARCLAVMAQSGCTRMEAKFRIALRRWPPRSVASAFYLDHPVPVDAGVYEGPVLIGVAGRDISTRGRLSGHLAAIDGRYHWRGNVAGDLPADLLRGTRKVTVTVGTRTAQARVVEQTPWGSHTIAGVGAPPFPLEEHDGDNSGIPQGKN